MVVMQGSLHLLIVDCCFCVERVVCSLSSLTSAACKATSRNCEQILSAICSDNPVVRLWSCSAGATAIFAIGSGSQWQSTGFHQWTAYLGFSRLLALKKLLETKCLSRWWLLNNKVIA